MLNSFKPTLYNRVHSSKRKAFRVLSCERAPRGPHLQALSTGHWGGSRPCRASWGLRGGRPPHSGALRSSQGPGAAPARDHCQQRQALCPRTACSLLEPAALWGQATVTAAQAWRSPVSPVVVRPREKCWGVSLGPLQLATNERTNLWMPQVSSLSASLPSLKINDPVSKTLY